MSLEPLFTALWQQYVAITPQAAKIIKLLSDRGESVQNDHIALRTYALDGVDIEDLDRAFVSAGFVPTESYNFQTKKLDACHYEHPRVGVPKVFISALRVNELSDEAAAVIHGLVEQMPKGAAAQPLFAASGRPWQIDSASYQLLAQESEYAAWVSAFGFRANHFTVLVNSLTSFASLEELNLFLLSEGLTLNTAGGMIKGSPEQLLEQSSTMADEVEVNFTDRTLPVPSCYYEFARRYNLPNGEPFSGFIPTSADRIFESTNRG